MKRIIPALVLFCISTHFVAAQTLPTPTRLAGIINLPDEKVAILETHDHGSSIAEWMFLQEGERQSLIEVFQIDPEAGTVKLAQGGTNLVLNLGRATDPAKADAASNRLNIELEKVETRQVLELYAQLKGRSVLHPELFLSSFDLKIAAKDRTEAAEAIEKALKDQGIATRLDGEKFVLVAPNRQMPTDTTNSPVSVLPAKGSAPQGKAIPPGNINFISIDVPQILQIYAHSVGRKLVPTKLPGWGLISFRSQTPLSVEEAIHALDTLLKWNGLKMVPVGDDSIKAVSISSP
ncbi:MAG: hypothetical protein JWR26_33 [Pedosphaera sp.]|nr:hypothetical protein [Pedosphaera sp.]